MALNDMEFLRSLMDLIAARSGSAPQDTTPTGEVEIEFNDFEHGGQDEHAGEDPLDRDDVFIPPLQAKLEIMKKLAGIEPKNQDLIASEASEDEPLEG